MNLIDNFLFLNLETCVIVNSIYNASLIFFSVIQLYAQDSTGENTDIDGRNNNILYIEDFSYPVFF